MANNDPEVTELEAAPDLLPLTAADDRYYVTTGSFVFGWSSGSNGEGAEFEISKYRWSGGMAKVASWPRTQDGWEQAWGYMRAEQPELAAAVVSTYEKGASSRAAALRRAENEAALEAEGNLELLAGCVLLGGYGLEESIAPGERVDIHFTQQGIWVAKAGGYRPYLRRTYESARVLEFEGGAIKTGGGYRGGGFGLIGAAEGMAIASLLNSLSTKTSVHTTVRFEAEDAEVFFFTDQAVPRTLEMRFAEVRARVKANPPPQPIPAAVAEQTDLATRLLRLGEMHDKGQLSDEEFALAKSHLFGQAS